MPNDICASCGMSWTEEPNNGFCCSAPIAQYDEEYIDEEYIKEE